MQGSSRKPDWKKWSRWLLWWKIDSEELRQQVAGYATLKVMESARGFSLLVAILALVGKWSMVGLFLTHGMAPYWPNFLPLQFGTGFVFLVLGYLAYRGRPKAIIGLMLLWTIDITTIATLYFRYQPHGINTAALLVATLLGWAYCMHPFYLARRVERARQQGV